MQKNEEAGYASSNTGSENIRTPHPEHQTHKKTFALSHKPRRKPNQRLLLLLVEFDLDCLLVAVAHNNQFQVAGTFLIDQPVQIRSRGHALAVYRNDAISGFQSGAFARLTGL